MPKKVLKFTDPNPHSVGMVTAMEMEEGTVAEGEGAMGSAQRTARQGRSPSNDLSLTRAQGLCDQCHGPAEYCHGHDSPEPLPVRPRELSRSPAPIASSPPRVVTPESRGSQSESLARNLINAILQHHDALDNNAPAVKENNEDTAMLPPPYPTEGVEVRGGRRGRRGRGNQARGGGPVRVLNIETLQPPPQYNGGRRPGFTGASIPEDRTIPPQGYEHNWGTEYIPFNIHDNYGREVPARFIQVHMQDPNPYAIGRMMNGGGDSFRGEIHAAPVHDVNHAAEPLTTPMLRMLGANYPAEEWIDSALERVRDRSLTAEVLRFRNFGPRIERQREQVRLME